jgi:hypothetical protein
MTEELTAPEPREIAPADSLLSVIAAAARDTSVDVGKMTALLDFKERVEAKEAEKAFNQAFARIQLKTPRVKKDGCIDFGSGKSKIPFATWENVDAVMRPLLHAEGFAQSFRSKATASGACLVLVVTHAQGHCETSEMQLPADTGPGRNQLQACGSAMSYCKRYLTLEFWNVVTEGQDDDAKKAFPLNADQLNNVISMVDACELSAAAVKSFLAFAHADSLETIQQHRYDDVMVALKKKLSQKQEAHA